MSRDRLEPVKATLEHYKVAAPVRFQVKPVAVLALLGPQADAVLARGRGRSAAVRRRSASRDERRRPFRSASFARATSRWRDSCCRWRKPRPRWCGWGSSPPGAGELAAGDLDALRVEAGRAWYGRDVTEANLLHETDLVAECCSFQKGCYLGQEVVARLDARGGHVNKRLRGLRLGGPRHRRRGGSGRRPGGRAASRPPRSPLASDPSPSPTSTGRTRSRAHASRSTAARPPSRRSPWTRGLSEVEHEDLHQDRATMAPPAFWAGPGCPRTTCAWPPTATWTS